MIFREFFCRGKCLIGEITFNTGHNSYCYYVVAEELPGETETEAPETETETEAQQTEMQPGTEAQQTETETEAQQTETGTDKESKTEIVKNGAGSFPVPFPECIRQMGDKAETKKRQRNFRNRKNRNAYK